MWHQSHIQISVLYYFKFFLESSHLRLHLGLMFEVLLHFICAWICGTIVSMTTLKTFFTMLYTQTVKKFACSVKLGHSAVFQTHSQRTTWSKCSQWLQTTVYVLYFSNYLYMGIIYTCLYINMITALQLFNNSFLLLPKKVSIAEPHSEVYQLSLERECRYKCNPEN